MFRKHDNKFPEKYVINRSKMRGITLLELLIALLIASVMLTIGVPSFQSVIANQRLTAATNELVMSMNLAKSEAIKRVSYVTVCISKDGVKCSGASWNEGWIVFANQGVANLDQIDAGDEVIRIYPAMRDSIGVDANGAIDKFVTFRPSGTVGTNAANMTGTITVCDDRGTEHARGLVVATSGRWGVSKHQDHDGEALACP